MTIIPSLNENDPWHSVKTTSPSPAKGGKALQRVGHRHQWMKKLNGKGRRRKENAPMFGTEPQTATPPRDDRNNQPMHASEGKTQGHRAGAF